MILKWIGGLALVACLACKGKPVQSGALVATTPAPPPVSAPAATAPPGTESGPDSCARICGRTRPLACKRATECVANCREMRQTDACVGEMTAVLTCFAREPVAHWECNEDGEAAIKDGYCDEEQGKLVACAQKTARGAAVPRPASRPTSL